MAIVYSVQQSFEIATAYIDAEAVGVLLSFKNLDLLFLAGEHDKVACAAAALASAACV
jgi:hypothetical protein